MKGRYMFKENLPCQTKNQMTVNVTESIKPSRASNRLPINAAVFPWSMPADVRWLTRVGAM
jgi:hypothetical protein